MSIAKFERDKVALRAAIKEEAVRHGTAIKELRAQLAQAEAGSNMASAGLDETKIELAQQVLIVRGSFATAGQDRQSVIDDAIADLLEGASKLRAQMFNTKDYAHWYGQRSDHPYGMGPRHGSIVFGVGVQPVYRTVDAFALSDEATDAAIYYLRNLTRIQEARAAAKTTADLAA